MRYPAPCASEDLSPIFALTLAHSQFQAKANLSRAPQTSRLPQAVVEPVHYLQCRPVQPDRGLEGPTRIRDADPPAATAASAAAAPGPSTPSRAPQVPARPQALIVASSSVEVT